MADRCHWWFVLDGKHYTKMFCAVQQKFIPMVTDQRQMDDRLTDIEKFTADMFQDYMDIVVTAIEHGVQSISHELSVKILRYIKKHQNWVISRRLRKTFDEFFPQIHSRGKFKWFPYK